MAETLSRKEGRICSVADRKIEPRMKPSPACGRNQFKSLSCVSWLFSIERCWKKITTKHTKYTKLAQQKSSTDFHRWGSISRAISSVKICAICGNRIVGNHHAARGLRFGAEKFFARRANLSCVFYGFAPIIVKSVFDPRSIRGYFFYPNLHSARHTKNRTGCITKTKHEVLFVKLT